MITTAKAFLKAGTASALGGIAFALVASFCGGSLHRTFIFACGTADAIHAEKYRAWDEQCQAEHLYPAPRLVLIDDGE